MPHLAPGSDDHLDEETSAAYALGALDGGERDLVDFHVRFCPRCAALVERDLRTATMLPFLVTPAVPPPDVKAALFARIGQTQRAALAPVLIDASPAARALPPTPTPTLPASTPPAMAPSAPTAPPVAARSLGRLGSILSVPLLVALVATGFWGAQMREQVALQGSRVDALEAQIANFGSSVPEQLSPGRAMLQAAGSVRIGADQTAGVLEVDLNSSEAAGTYALWGVNEAGDAVLIEDFQVGPDGIGEAVFSLDQPFSNYTKLQVLPGSSKNVSDESAVLQLNPDGLGSTGSSLEAGT